MKSPSTPAIRGPLRQIHGCKSVHEFIPRYGEWAVFINPDETFDQILRRFQQFNQSGFDTTYAHFLKTQQRIHVLYRLAPCSGVRHYPRRCLKQYSLTFAKTAL